MIRFIAVFVVSSSVLLSQAQAGFEFLAPKGGMAPRAEVSTPPAAPQPILPKSQMMPTPVAPPVMPPNAFPAAPVMAQPLNNVAPPPAPTGQEQVMRSLEKPFKTGLYIDPYPLRTQDNIAMVPSSQSVAQGMAENGGGLTPVQLGAGMTSGAKAQKANNQKAMNGFEPPRPPMQPMMASSGLTPIPGGEPAPLPNVAGIEQAYRDNSYSAQQIPVQYANAVGFGKELPLELALSQVIPEGFTYDIVGEVNESATVSWEGGEPWNVVLNNMLRTQNMTAIINGDQVTIQPMARL